MHELLNEEFFVFNPSNVPSLFLLHTESRVCAPSTQGPLPGIHKYCAVCFRFFFLNERSRIFLIDELFVRHLLSLPRGSCCGGFGELPVMGVWLFDGWGDDQLVLQEPTFVQMTFLPLVWVAQSFPTLCDPMDCSPPGSSVHGILPARILEWVAMPSSRGSSRPRDRTRVSHIAGGFFNHLSHQGSPNPASSWAFKVSGVPGCSADHYFLTYGL